MKHADSAGLRIAAGRFIWSVLLIIVTFGTGNALADAKDDLARRKSDWDSVKQKMEEVSGKVRDYLEKSRGLRKMDEDDLASLIVQICGTDIKRDDDEGDRLAKQIVDKMVDTVNREYDHVSSDGGRLEEEALRVLDDAKSLRDNTKDLASDDDVKDEANQLLSEMSQTIDDFTNTTWEALSSDYKTLDNVKDGVMKGANNPKIRAAMEYGKQKHQDLQRDRECAEKEVVLDSGRRPDCITFEKDACVVWEFKPDSTFTESSAADVAQGYVADVQEKFKDDPRAIENCKKDSDGRPVFEARGQVYEACRP